MELVLEEEDEEDQDGEKAIDGVCAVEKSAFMSLKGFGNPGLREGIVQKAVDCWVVVV